MKTVCGLLAAALTLIAAPARADDAQTREAARAVLAQYRDAVVTVKLVVKTRILASGREINKSESQLELAGTVLTPAGLTVLSDSSTNPSSLLSLLGEDDERFKIESETTDVKLLLPDGQEVEARFVLRDKDLDLAFVLPKEEGPKRTHVPLEQGPVPKVLDDLIFLYRTGKALNREAGVALGRVEAVVKRPRTFVVPDAGSSQHSLGCPVFDATGRPVGVAVTRRATGAKGSSSLSGPLRVVLTAEDLADAAKQALQAKADGK